MAVLQVNFRQAFQRGGAERPGFIRTRVVEAFHCDNQGSFDFAFPLQENCYVSATISGFHQALAL